MLKCLLDSLIKQFTNNQFTFEIIVIDNDVNRTGESVVYDFRKYYAVEVIYDCEPEQNISLARNRAIANAHGDLIAFIDDDEFASPLWLSNCFEIYRKYQIDGILGPVKPVFEGMPPDWLVKSKLCDRDSFPTGTILDNIKFMRTGNVFFSRDILEGSSKPFDPGLGLTGGEDVDFFNRMLQNKRTFLWCDEAVVFELVPKERQQISYYVRRAILRGIVHSKKEAMVSLGTLKSLSAVTFYTVSLPTLMAVSHPLFLRYFIKDCEHLSKLLGHCNILLIEKRNF